MKDKIIEIFWDNIEYYPELGAHLDPDKFDKIADSLIELFNKSTKNGI